MAEVTDTEALVESVTAGDHDGHLVDIIEAIRLRFTFGTTQQKWSLGYKVDDGEHEVREEDLTLGEARLVERMAGTNWGLLNPASSSSECLAIIAACLHVRHGKTLSFTKDGPKGEAYDLASSVPADEAAVSISSYEVDRPPKP